MAKSHAPLVQPMFDGPVDVVADVHGEFDTLCDLLQHLGYGEDGRHRDDRRLVFVGDLIDRGPDSVGVVELVRRMIDAGRAQCILGNHELNILRHKMGPHNDWFRNRKWKIDGEEIPTVRLQRHQRDEMLNFFRSLPVALERSDLRVVHACWDDGAINSLRDEDDALGIFNDARDQITERLDDTGTTDEIERNLAHQNENPVKLITSGPEYRAPKPFMANNKIRNEARHPWWEDYDAEPLCVCGHYWRIPLPGKLAGDSLFTGYDLHAPLGNGRVMCIDYSVGGRYLERRMNGSRTSCSVAHTNGATHPAFTGRLAALRWPESVLVFDNGGCHKVICSTVAEAR